MIEPWTWKQALAFLIVWLILNGPILYVCFWS